MKQQETTTSEQEQKNPCDIPKKTGDSESLQYIKKIYKYNIMAPYVKGQFFSPILLKQPGFV